MGMRGGGGGRAHRSGTAIRGGLASPQRDALVEQMGAEPLGVHGNVPSPARHLFGQRAKSVFTNFLQIHDLAGLAAP